MRYVPATPLKPRAGGRHERTVPTGFFRGSDADMHWSLLLIWTSDQLIALWSFHVAMLKNEIKCHEIVPAVHFYKVESRDTVGPQWWHPWQSLDGPKAGIQTHLWCFYFLSIVTNGYWCTAKCYKTISLPIWVCKNLIILWNKRYFLICFLVNREVREPIILALFVPLYIKLSIPGKGTPKSLQAFIFWTLSALPCGCIPV